MVRCSIGLICAFFLLGACSSEDAAEDDNQPYAPAGNGVPMSEADACKAITGAEDDRRAALSCGPVTRPPCPVYIQNGNPACSAYDQGTVQACAGFVGEQPSCDALTQKKCLLKIIPGSAPSGC
ncbi:MAG: hypothetical protein IT377_32385 [Polyangiaceae bacterium]|nr:hypothetical protein [Polyangiaceae bacterium]